MTSDDNHDDDAQLQQLRAVWVSMRDEEPPDRGLAALMAAARTKAAELEHAASPSWWQRVAATLRRPPVLALATVTLLLGGALIVTQRSSQMKVDATAVDESSALEYAAPATGGVERGVPAPAAPEPTPTTEAVATPPAVRDARPAAKTKPKIAGPASTAKRSPDLDTAKATTADKADESYEGGLGASGAGAPVAPAVLSIAQDDAPGAAPAAQQQAPKKPIARTPAPPIEGEDRATSKGSAQPTVAQLVKQCETAAARGDCAAVRAIAQKILTTAPATYKTKVANNAAITRCMPDAAPNSAAQ